MLVQTKSILSVNYYLVYYRIIKKLRNKNIKIIFMSKYTAKLLYI